MNVKEQCRKMISGCGGLLGVDEEVAEQPPAARRALY